MLLTNGRIHLRDAALVDAHAHLISLAKSRLERRVAHFGSEDDAVAVVAKAAGTGAPDDFAITSL